MICSPDGSALEKAQYWDANVTLKPFPSKSEDFRNTQNGSSPLAAVTPPVMISLEVISRLVFNEGIGSFEDPVTGSTYSFDASSNTYSLIKAGTRLEDQAKVIKAGAFAMPSTSMVATVARPASSVTPVVQKSQKKIQIQLQKWQTRQQETLIEEPSEKASLTESFVKAGDNKNENSASSVIEDIYVPYI
jgi:hypothetical protein